MNFHHASYIRLTTSGAWPFFQQVAVRVVEVEFAPTVAVVDLVALLGEARTKNSAAEPRPALPSERPVYDPSNPSLGIFSDDPGLVDEVMNYVYQSRANDPLRTRD